MTAPAGKLASILRLEAEKCQDRAVIGGLACYADTWLREAGAACGPEAAGWVQAIAERLRTYSTLPDAAARREAVTELLGLLKAAPARASQPQATLPPAPSVTPASAEPTPVPSPPPPPPPAGENSLDSPTAVRRGVGARGAERVVKVDVHKTRESGDFFMCWVEDKYLL